MDIIAFILSIICLLWLIIGSIIFINTKKQLQQITKGVSKKDLKTILSDISNSLKKVDEEIGSINQDISEHQKMMKDHFQKMGYVRFNPFSDTGGNQSFCLCLLNDHNDGIVITSLHSRDSTRIYTKLIAKGEADGRELSKEEQQALKKALKKSI